MANILTRQDDGSGASPAAFWTVGAGALTTSAGRLRQQTGAGGAEGYSDTPRGSLDSWAVGDRVFTRIYGTGNDRRLWLGIRADGEAKVFGIGFDTTGTFGTNASPQLFTYDYTAGTAPLVTTYDPVAHAYVGLLRTATGIDFQVASAGASWTTLTSATQSITSNVISAFIDVSHLTTQIIGEFDDFNIVGGGGGGGSSAIPLLLRAGRLGGR